jgi:DNA (cytosine-5)-methyltransferase 1
VKILDLFCGAGGAAKGYADMGHEVLGVDINPQPNFPYRFIQADAVEILEGIGPGEFDLIHASPPCQRYSTMTKRWGREGEHPDLVDPVRDHLLRIGGLWVIENVAGAPLRSPVTLCGSMFGLGDSEGRGLRRHRLFEASFPIPVPGPCVHRGQAVGVYGNPGGSSKRDGIRFASFANWQEAMEIDWMTVREIGESIPPAYTRWIVQHAPFGEIVGPREEPEAWEQITLW